MGRGRSKVGGSNKFREVNDRQLLKLARDLKQEEWQLDSDEIRAADGYFGTSESFTLNRKLREGKRLSPHEKSVVSGLERSMKPMPYDFTSMRMVGDKFLHSLGVTDTSGHYTADTVKDLIGIQFSTPQFTSTSAIRKSNVFGGRSCELELRVKKGTSVLVSPHRAHFPTLSVDEGEVLLGRNAPMEVVGAQTINKNKIKLIVEVG